MIRRKLEDLGDFLDELSGETDPEIINSIVEDAKSTLEDVVGAIDDIEYENNIIGDTIDDIRDSSYLSDFCSDIKNPQQKIREIVY